MLYRPSPVAADHPVLFPDDGDRNAFYAPESRWVLDSPRPVAALGLDTTLTTWKETDVHSHRKSQLLLTLSGVVTCEAGPSAWIVPSNCALWIPGGVPHRCKAAGRLRVCNLFIEPGAAALPAECCTVRVPPLLRELILQTALFPRLYDLDGPHGRIAGVLLDQLAVAPLERLQAPMPADPRLRRIAEAMLADPSERLTMAQWGRRVGASERTLTRLLRRDTGMSFGRWRQQLHVLLAVQRLAEGAPVQNVAADLGYESASAFITMFRRTLGRTPARYLAERGGSL